MKNKVNINPRQLLQQKLKVNLRTVSLGVGIFCIVALVAFIIMNLGNKQEAKASGELETFTAGSFIVNMGVTPQTTSNGLKPYGLIYDLIKNYQVPVKWIIEPTKAKDGTDFTYNSVNYRGGPFIIPKEFITPTITSRISYWQTQGVQGVYTTIPITVPVEYTITSFPNIMIDTLSSLQSIIINYYNNAGIPSSAYNLGSPSGLNQCHDIWTNPHGDPVWATHYYLYNFVTVQRSFIWAECHSVSMMEGSKNPNPPYEGLNFLTTNGLQCWSSGACGTIPEAHTLSASSPYNYYYPTDPVMQFMGNMELCTQVGSERWFIPLTTGGWNSATRRGVTTGSTTSPREGVLLVYGRAFGNASNGLVMYEAGHDLTGGGGGAAQPHKVSAQRAYFNFLLLAGKERKLNITANFPGSVASGLSYPVSATTNTGTPAFTYQWTSNLGGAFGNPVDSSTTYTAPFVVKDTFDVVKVTVTDQCGKKTFEYKYIPLTVLPLPVTLLSFTAEVNLDTVHLKWVTATEMNNDYFSLSRSIDGQIYYEIGTVKGKGNSSTQNSYEFKDVNSTKGIVYYRLSQTDNDGKLKVFKPIALNLSRSLSAFGNPVVHPNPFSKQFSVSAQSEQLKTVTITLMTLQGKLVESKHFFTKKGFNQFDFPLTSDVAPGIYLVGIKSETDSQIIQKVIKN